MWGKYNIDTDKSYVCAVGKKKIFIKKRNKEWLLHEGSKELSNGCEFVSCDTSEMEDWNVVVADKNNTINILPSLPNLPVVVRPQYSFKLLPAMHIELFVNIPVWVQFYAGIQKKENLLADIPVMQLSNTWFGDPDNGSLCYSLPGNIYSHLLPDQIPSYMAVCTLKIFNDASTTLDFQRLLLQLDAVNLYLSNGVLYTNEIKVKFKGENQVSDFMISKQTPSFVQNAKHLAHPRNTDKDGVLKKSYYFFKSLTDF